jgi:hypothetical protein
MAKLRLLILVIITILASCNSVPRDLLLDDQYTQLVVEVAPAVGCEPNLDYLRWLQTKIHKYCKKPKGVFFIIHPSITIAPITTWTVEDLEKFEEENRLIQNKKHIRSVFISYLPGTTEAGTSSGLTYGETSFVIFPDHMGMKVYEKTVLLHEFGHLLGLVNYGTKDLNNHHDTEHESHCKNIKCVMYWKTDRNQLDFDEDCQLDLKEKAK